MKFLQAIILFTLIVFSGQHALFAQQDSTYYESYSRRVTARFYFSQKYTTLKIRNTDDHYTLHYRPNTTLNMGVGATYKWATINLAYGFPFLNPDQSKGRTKYLDLQFHGYGQKFNLDVLGQFYRGFYLYPKGAGGATSYYQRPDLRVNIIGASYQYIFNNRRFSFRSSILQSEWQKKSAGTLLLGVEAYTGRVKADSSLVPSAIDASSTSLGNGRTVFVEVGPNVGYAYTWVIATNFFLTGSTTASFDYGFNVTKNNQGARQRAGFSPNTSIRLSAGYNSANWAFSFVYINSNIKIAKLDPGTQTSLSAGYFRANFIYRLHLDRKQKKILERALKSIR